MLRIQCTVFSTTTVFVSAMPLSLRISSTVEFISAIFAPETITAMSYSPVISNIESTPLTFLSLAETSIVGEFGFTDSKLIALAWGPRFVSTVNFEIAPLFTRFDTLLRTAASERLTVFAISTKGFLASSRKIDIIRSSVWSANSQASALASITGFFDVLASTSPRMESSSFTTVSICSSVITSGGRKRNMFSPA